MLFYFIYFVCYSLSNPLRYGAECHAVTMQAQKVVPPVMVCKDKFLIQSTVVPVGTTERDITSSTVSVFEVLLFTLNLWLSLYDFFFFAVCQK